MTHRMRILSGKEKKALQERVDYFLPDASSILSKKSDTKEYELAEGKVLTFEDRPILIEVKGHLLPALHAFKHHKITLPVVKVDQGAIRFVTNGADIMRPGITYIDPSVTENSPVVILEDTKDTPLAVGISKYDAVDMKAMETGKVIKVLHYLTDKFWTFSP